MYEQLCRPFHVSYVQDVSLHNVRLHPSTPSSLLHLPPQAPPPKGPPRNLIGRVWGPRSNTCSAERSEGNTHHALPFLHLQAANRTQKCQLMKPANRRAGRPGGSPAPLLAPPPARGCGLGAGGCSQAGPARHLRSPRRPPLPPQAGSPGCCPAAPLRPRGAAGPAGCGWATAAVGRREARGCAALRAGPGPGPLARCGAAPGGLGGKPRQKFEGRGVGLLGRWGAHRAGGQLPVEGLGPGQYVLHAQLHGQLIDVLGGAEEGE